MDINKFIDWEKLFNACIEDCRQYMENRIKAKDEEDGDTYKKILDFHLRQNSDKTLEIEKLDIDLESSEIREDVIIFAFSEEYQTANESNNQNGWLIIEITYDRYTELFTHYEQEQG